MFLKLSLPPLVQVSQFLGLMSSDKARAAAGAARAAGSARGCGAPRRGAPRRRRDPREATLPLHGPLARGPRATKGAHCQVPGRSRLRLSCHTLAPWHRATGTTRGLEIAAPFPWRPGSDSRPHRPPQAGPAPPAAQVRRPAPQQPPSHLGAPRPRNLGNCGRRRRLRKAPPRTPPGRVPPSRQLRSGQGPDQLSGGVPERPGRRRRGSRRRKPSLPAAGLPGKAGAGEEAPRRPRLRERYAGRVVSSESSPAPPDLQPLESFPNLPALPPAMGGGFGRGSAAGAAR
ncbi:unnamed protein product [Rangifer tarandus platyrhynchus]|uniref:Basic proline-rich protein-like n=1 Tax=Rangifer tarandus platyrhynchus TaxID=3082113 RepID=A0ABN9A0I0_RANTA|nr:unnamed protein product [Rangifer tarandus platyrhynchus]